MAELYSIDNSNLSLLLLEKNSGITLSVGALLHLSSTVEPESLTWWANEDKCLVFLFSHLIILRVDKIHNLILHLILGGNSLASVSLLLDF